MSATRDTSQKVAFVYSNLYEIYRKGKAAALEAEVPAPEAQGAPVVTPKKASSSILKTDDLRKDESHVPQVSAYNPMELIGKRFARPRSVATATQKPKVASPAAVLSASNPAISGLKQNLQALNDLHSRLRFMLEELEDLVKE